MSDKTQVEQILTVLDGTTRGLTSNEIFERLDIPKNTLATHIWKLRKDGLISRVSGSRGSYRYALTQKGREWFDDDVDPLTKLTKVVRDSEGGFAEMLQVIESLDQYKSLRSFVGWLPIEHPELVNLNEPGLERKLTESVLQFLGVNVAAYNKQRKSLESLLGLLDL